MINCLIILVGNKLKPDFDYNATDKKAKEEFDKKKEEQNTPKNKKNIKLNEDTKGNQKKCCCLLF